MSRFAFACTTGRESTGAVVTMGAAELHPRQWFAASSLLWLVGVLAAVVASDVDVGVDIDNKKSSVSSTTTVSQPTTMLFMSVSDVRDSWGLV